MPHPLQRISRIARHPGWVAFVLFALMPLAWSVSFLSYAHPKETWILTVGAMLSLAHAVKGEAGEARHLRSLMLCLLPVALWLAWGMVVAQGQFAPYATAISGFGLLLTGIALAPLAAMAEWRNRLYAAFLLGAVLVALLALGQYVGALEVLFPAYAHYDQRVYSVFGNQDLLGGYMALAAVIAAGLLLSHARPSILLWLALPLFVLALALSGCRTAWLAAALGLGCQCFLLRERLRMRPALPIALSVLLPAVLSVLLSWEQTGQRVARLFNGGETGGRVRLWMADAALRMGADHPLAGVGPGQFRWRSPAYMGDAIQSASDGLYGYNELWAELPHSILLELWAEGGLVGLALGGGSLALLLCFRRSWGAWPGLVTLGVFSLFNDTLHSAPHALIGVWFIACLLKREPDSEHALTMQHLPRSTWSSLAMVQVVVAVLHGVFILYPSALLTRAEDEHLAGSPNLTLYERAARHPFVRPGAYLGMATLHVEEEAWPEALAAARVASEELDTWTVHWVIGLSAAHMGDETLARESLRRCLHRAPRNARAFALLWEVTPVEERPDLLAHAKVWGQEIPSE